jgi:hypothetical protein
MAASSFLCVYLNEKINSAGLPVVNLKRCPLTWMFFAYGYPCQRLQREDLFNRENLFQMRGAFVLKRCPLTWIFAVIHVKGNGERVYIKLRY